MLAPMHVSALQLRISSTAQARWFSTRATAGVASKAHAAAATSDKSDHTGGSIVHHVSTGKTQLPQPQRRATARLASTLYRAPCTPTHRVFDSDHSLCRRSPHERPKDKRPRMAATVQWPSKAGAAAVLQQKLPNCPTMRCSAAYFLSGAGSVAAIMPRGVIDQALQSRCITATHSPSEAGASTTWGAATSARASASADASQTAQGE
jgi:hypothetical protein